MRTKVRLDEDLMADVKRFAAARGETLTAVLERALRELLARSRVQVPRAAPALPTFTGRGLQPGVDLYDTAALVELIESDD